MGYAASRAVGDAKVALNRHRGDFTSMVARGTREHAEIAWENPSPEKRAGPGLIVLRLHAL
jgi:hypothetical protein